MDKLIINLNDREYPLSTKLRVAYKIQGQHSHKPYSQIFKEMEGMTLEQQIDMLYASFTVANPEDAKTITRQQFLDSYLDNYDLSDLMGRLEAIISGIMGTDLVSESEAGAEGN